MISISELEKNKVVRQPTLRQKKKKPFPLKKLTENNNVLGMQILFAVSLFKF